MCLHYGDVIGHDSVAMALEYAPSNIQDGIREMGRLVDEADGGD